MRARDARIIRSAQDGAESSTEYGAIAHPASLGEANRLLTLAEEMAHVGHWQFDQISGAGYFSAEASRIFGFDPTTACVTRTDVLGAYHPDDQAHVGALLRDHIKAGTPFEYQARIVRPGGEIRCVLVRGRCDRNPRGTSVVTFGTVLDVTETRRAEEQLQAATELLKTTLNAMDQGLIMVDAGGIVRVCNARAIELLELPPEMMRTEPAFEAVLAYQQQHNEFAMSDEAFRQWVAGGGLEPSAHTYERERPNGTILEIRTVPFGHGSAVRTYTDVTERKAAERRISHMARHDALTDLPNRTLFRERLGERLAEVGRYGGACAVLCLDLDRFKAVNDTLGHLAGDALLREVAQRLRATSRAEDTVARLGGDEFAILVARPGRPRRVAALAERLIAAVRHPVAFGDQQVEVGLSLGIALAPSHGSEGDDLLKRADLALYRAKAEGRNTYRFFEPAMDEAAAERRRLELDLRRALGAGELALYYQPQVTSATGELVGFEALARWHHPTRGFVSPATFIPLAEETGLIAELGEWVLRTACAEAAGWARPLKIAVNLSPRQFQQSDLPKTVLAILAETGLAPARLELEITEGVIINDMTHALGVLRRLKGLGIGIAMDDFGTGYSSLATLQAFPFDKIKIDQSFVSRIGSSPQAAVIVRAVLGLGRSLDMTVVAEGVETDEQMRFLAAEGCEEVQGFLFGAPEPIETFAEALRDVRDRTGDLAIGPTPSWAPAAGPGPYREARLRSRSRE